MNKLLSAAALGLSATLACIAAPAQAADVGVSINFSQPGVYGRVDIGRFPQPVLIAPRPVIVTRAPVAYEPVYLWVPPAHRQNWRRYCGRYGACNAPVYFVQDRWYQQRVMPVYHAEQRQHRHDRRAGPPGHRNDRHDNGRGRGHGKDDRHDRGPGRGHGHH